MVVLEHKLNEYFGFEEFRPGQKETIAALLDGYDTLTQLPTGSGKSLCYQLAGYLLEGLVVVVTPLISLMEDQVQRLYQQQETRVTYINSQLSFDEKEYILTHLSMYKFLFVSPEMLQQKRLLDQLRKINIALFVVDEAHCISQWGIDFRPEYRQLHQIQEQLQFPLTLALTASATPQVRNEIRTLLFRTQQKEFVYSINRPNIQLFVQKTEDKVQSLKEALHSSNGAVIIYCATRKQVEELYRVLKTEYAVGYYHGGLTSNERSSLQQQFKQNQLEILIATNAFGMGIDKADIRFVIHFDLPDSVENYVQEIGRAGRDGQESYALLLYQEQDERIHYFFQDKFAQEIQELEWLTKQQDPYALLPKQDTIHTKWLREYESNPVFLDELMHYQQIKKAKLCAMKQYIEEQDCYRAYLLAYFEENAIHDTKNCCSLDTATWPKGARLNGFQTSVVPWRVQLAKIFKER